MSKCIGCGVELQNNNPDLLGYTNSLENELCERCFRIKNYNEYKYVKKDNNDYINILKNVSNTNDLVVLVVDLFNIPINLLEIFKYLSNDILLVLSKRDLLPKSCYDKKLLDYFNNYSSNIIDSIIISSNKNYNLDELYEKIIKYKKSKNVYVVGFTNSGKSTLINKIIYNYSNISRVITTSNLPSTTIDSIIVKINDDLTLIDTPGLIDSLDISNNIDSKTLKRIIPNKEIKPLTYQIKDKQTIFVDNILRIDIYDKTNITIYMSNKLNIKRIYKQSDDLKLLKKYEFNIKDNNDLVIQGLGFLKFTNACKVDIYIDLANVYTRKSLI